LSHVCLVGARGRRELQCYSPHQYRAGGVDDVILGGRERERGGRDESEGGREGGRGGREGREGRELLYECTICEEHVTLGEVQPCISVTLYQHM